MTGRRERSDSGQSTLEFALILPIVAVIVLGLIQGLVLGLDAARVAGAAREAARAASVGNGSSGVHDAALRGGGDLDPSRVEVVTSPDPAVPGQPVTVEVRYRTEFVLPGVAALTDPPVLSSSVTLMAE